MIKIGLLLSRLPQAKKPICRGLVLKSFSNTDCTILVCAYASAFHFWVHVLHVSMPTFGRALCYLKITANLKLYTLQILPS